MKTMSRLEAAKLAVNAGASEIRFVKFSGVFLEIDGQLQPVLVASDETNENPAVPAAPKEKKQRKPRSPNKTWKGKPISPEPEPKTKKLLPAAPAPAKFPPYADESVQPDPKEETDGDDEVPWVPPYVDDSRQPDPEDLLNGLIEEEETENDDEVPWA